MDGSEETKRGRGRPRKTAAGQTAKAPGKPGRPKKFAATGDIQRDYIIGIRAMHGMTQEQLAERLGVTRQAVSQWELGGRGPTGPAKILLAQLAGLR